MATAEPQQAQELYTRGGPNVPDNRGESLVAVHAERMQKEKEEAGMRIVRALVPNLTPAVCALALAETSYDGRGAALLLQKFCMERDADLKQLKKESKKRKKAALEAQEKAQKKTKGRDKAKGSDSDASASDSGSSSGSDDGSSDDSGSESDSSVDRKRKRRKKDKKDKRGKKKRSSKEDRKEKDKKRSKKQKRRKRRRDSSSTSPEPEAGAHAVPKFGQYGIVKESDFDAKRGDFMCWAMEIKKVDPEMLPKFEERELWKTYMEDYNTATLPHEKYYDVAAYGARKQAKVAKGGKAKKGERTAFNDEAERRRELMELRAKEQQERLQQAYEELKYTDKAQDMREQELLRMQMKLAYRTGDHAKAEKLADRLRPEDKK